MKYITENDKQLVDKMLEVSFQLGEKQTFIYTKSLSKMLDCLKYAYKENDVFRPNKIVQRMIEDVFFVTHPIRFHKTYINQV